MPSPSSNWLVRWGEQRADADVRLVCFPHAGAGPNVYRAWREHLPSSVTLYAVHLPGRGSRLAEPAIDDIDAMARAVAPAILAQIPAPMVFFGHSMGAVLGYEVARHLRAAGQPEPSLLAVSGRTAPHLLSREPQTYHLPQDELIETLLKVGGTPPQVLADQELLALVLPMVRADLAAIDTYRLTPGEPLTCPIVAFGGEADEAVNQTELGGWGAHTTGSFDLHMYPGGHFFLHEDAPSVVATLADAIARTGVRS